MTTYLVVSVVSGIVFGILDGVINANPLARRLYAVYSPLAKTAVNVPAGIGIDLLHGLVMAWVFLLLYPSLPGESGILKGISYAFVVWYFRVVMYAASQWMMFVVPARTLLYTMAAGLGEMLVLGILFGLTLSPAQ